MATKKNTTTKTTKKETNMKVSEHTPRLLEKYNEEIVQEMMKEFGIENEMAVPKLTKIVINSGIGEAKNDSSLIEDMVRDVAMLAGQRPVVTTAKKAVSNFKIRQNEAIGVKVTLRKHMMWYFLDRLIAIVLPRIKDFQGVPTKSFDGSGNYALGIREHTVFPEVDATKVRRILGLQIIIGTDAGDDELARALLKKLGMPFQKDNK